MYHHIKYQQHQKWPKEAKQYIRNNITACRLIEADRVLRLHIQKVRHKCTYLWQPLTNSAFASFMYVQLMLLSSTTNIAILSVGSRSVILLLLLCELCNASYANPIFDIIDIQTFYTSPCMLFIDCRCCILYTALQPMMHEPCLWVVIVLM